MSVEEDTHDSSTIVLKLGSYEGRLAEDLPVSSRLPGQNAIVTHNPER